MPASSDITAQKDPICQITTLLATSKYVLPVFLGHNQVQTTDADDRHLTRIIQALYLIFHYFDFLL